MWAKASEAGLACECGADVSPVPVKSDLTVWYQDEDAEEMTSRQYAVYLFREPFHTAPANFYHRRWR